MKSKIKQREEKIERKITQAQGNNLILDIGLLTAELKGFQEAKKIFSEEIDDLIKYYSMPLKDRLKLKVDFETGEAGHKIVILKKLKVRLGK